MKHATQVDFLAQKNLFDHKAKVSTASWISLGNAIEQVDLASGELLQAQGQITEYVYFLSEGIAREFASRRGTEFDRAFHRGPTTVGLLSSYKAGTPNPSSISMITSGKVYRIPCRTLVSLLAAHSDLEHWYLVTVSRQCLLLQSRLRNLLQLNSDERLNSFLQENPDLIRALPARHIASYLEVPAVIVSIVKRKLTMESPLAAMSLTA